VRVFKYIYIVFFGVGISFGASAQNHVQNNGDFRLHTGANVAFYGNLTNQGSMTSNQGGMHFLGSTLQNIDGANVIQARDAFINNTSDVKLDNEFQISNQLTFTGGNINSDRADAATEFVHFLEGSSYIGATNAKHINGVVRKTGNTVFTFPVGNDANLQSFSITAPTAATDHFTAYYSENTATIDGFDAGIKDFPTVDHVSTCEWWQINRTGGISNVSLILNFDANSCGVTNLADLLVVHWDGTQWESVGNGGTTGTVAAGTIQTGAAISTFSPFTLGSSSSANPLPVTLLSFEVIHKENAALVQWKTASELNNDYFELEKSRDLSSWEVINTKEGAGNSNQLLSYKYDDLSLWNGLQYYRLKQVDYDGSEAYSDIKSLFVNEFDKENFTFIIYPNPVGINESFMIKNIGIKKQDFILEVYDPLGRRLMASSYNLEGSDVQEVLLGPLTTGYYSVRILDQQSSMFTHEKLLVR